MSYYPTRDDDGSGNAISFIVATLATEVADPGARLAAIKASVRAAKAHVQALPRHAMMQYTMLLMAPTVLTLLSGVGGRTPPMFNITISNVPGPAEPLFFRGAELLAIYPASIVTHGQALNITCESYAGRMNFGFTACHDVVPGVQRLALHAAEALAELEAAFVPARARRAAGSGAAPAKRTRRKPARKSANESAAGRAAKANSPRAGGRSGRSGPGRASKGNA